VSVAKRNDIYFISAGEFSGDLLASDLVLALRERLPKLTAAGVVGAAMRHAGVAELATIDDFSVMGVSDVARKLADLRMLETRLLAWVDRMRPKFAVLVDNPGFHLRFAEQLKMRGVTVFQYVAPKIWAWGAGRAEAIRASYDAVLGILPFEESFFRKSGIDYVYVGSPLKDRVDKVIVRREVLGLPRGVPVIACLPGSRPAEINLNLPTIAAVRDFVARELGQAEFIVPVAPNLAVEAFTSALGQSAADAQFVPAGQSGLTMDCWRVRGLTLVPGMSLETMAVADAAIVVSGTATLECALLGTPLVVVYRMTDLTYRIAQRAVKLPYVSLVNLLAGRSLVREFIQEFSIQEVAQELVSLLRDDVRRKAMREAFEDLRDDLKGKAADTAAVVIATRTGEMRAPPAAAP
jgi:lipid-A-disaccharide synthase